MDLWFVGGLVVLLNYWIRAELHRRARRLDQDPELRLRVEDELWSGRAVGPAIRGARRRITEPSDDPAIEHARRSVLAAFGIAILWMVVGLPISTEIGDFARQAAVRGSGYVLVLAADLLVGAVWILLLADSLVGPRANRRLMSGALLGIVGVAIVAATLRLAIG